MGAVTRILDDLEDIRRQRSAERKKYGTAEFIRRKQSKQARIMREHEARRRRETSAQRRAVRRRRRSLEQQLRKRQGDVEMFQHERGVEHAEKMFPGRRCLQMGRNNYACLTDSQWAKLFGRTRKDPSLLGCGSYACVYKSRNPGKVVKLTSDPGDVHTTMEAQGIPSVVTLYRAWQLAGQQDTWAMELERVRPLTGEVYDRWDRTMDCLRERRVGEMGPQFCCRPRRVYGRLVSPPLQQCRALARMIKQTSSALVDRGLRFTDWHVGNVGRGLKGQWKLIDLGHNVRWVEQRPLLQGAPRG